MSTLNSICTYHYQEKIHISFFEACFLIPMSLFVMYICISLNKIVFKPILLPWCLIEENYKCQVSVRQNSATGRILFTFNFDVDDSAIGAFFNQIDITLGETDTLQATLL